MTNDVSLQIRLRDLADNLVDDQQSSVCSEAANEIDQLRKEIGIILPIVKFMNMRLK